MAGFHHTITHLSQKEHQGNKRRELTSEALGLKYPETHVVKNIVLNLIANCRTTSGGNRSGLSSPYDSNTNVVGAIPSPAQPGSKTTSAPTSPLKVVMVMVMVMVMTAIETK